MCFIETKTQTFVLNFKYFFHGEKVLRALGMKSEE